VSREFTIRGKLWRYPGPGGWHFVTLAKGHAGALKMRPRETKVGWGYVPMRATLGKSTWRTTLFPTKEGKYLLAVKKALRAAEGVADGDTVRARVALV